MARIQLSPDKSRDCLDDLSAVAEHLRSVGLLFPDPNLQIILRGIAERIDENVLQLILEGAIDPDPNPRKPVCPGEEHHHHADGLDYEPTPLCVGTWSDCKSRGIPVIPYACTG
jgi:hypothetical protein